MSDNCTNHTDAHNKVQYYTIASDQLSVRISNLGATIRDIVVKTPKGGIDVALGGTDTQFEQSNPLYMGATIGRTCNRIAQGKFCLNGKDYQLYCNGGGNHLHGGKCGFDRKLFELTSLTPNSITLSYNSADGEEGYSGNLSMSVEFDILGGQLHITYSAVCDQDTLFCPTNHTYFNLNGQGNGDCLDNLLQVYANSYTPLGNNYVPTGEIASVKGTPMDLTMPAPIASVVNSNHPQIAMCGGLDHNYCVEGGLIARAFSTQTGIQMTVHTDQCGVQVYSGNCINNVSGKGLYPKYGGFCLETQCYPNAINIPNFGKSPVLRANEQYKSRTTYSFCCVTPIKA